jgi:histone deacetylase 1/2
MSTTVDIHMITPIFVFFGCLCYVLASYKHTRLACQSVECVFLGYSAKHKGYCCWDLVARCMRISRDVSFDQSHSFYPQPSSNVSPRTIVEPLSFLTFPDTPISIVFLPPPPSSLSPLLPYEPPSHTFLASIYDSNPHVIHTYSHRLQDPSPPIESPSDVSPPIETSLVEDSSA